MDTPFWLSAVRDILRLVVPAAVPTTITVSSISGRPAACKTPTMRVRGFAGVITAGRLRGPFGTAPLVWRQHRQAQLSWQTASPHRTTGCQSPGGRLKCRD